MLGPGKYDEVCAQVRTQVKAEGVILLVFNGEKGTGFSCQTPLPVIVNLPSILRSVADQIEADQKSEL